MNTASCARTRPGSALRRGVMAVGVGIAFAGAVQAADPAQVEVIVTSPGHGTQPFLSAVNAGGIVEANTARVENGVIYLDHIPDSAATPAPALTAAR